MPSAFAIRTCVSLRACRSSCKVISSAIRTAARASILFRRAEPICPIFWVRVFIPISSSPFSIVINGYQIVHPLWLLVDDKTSFHCHPICRQPLAAQHGALGRRQRLRAKHHYQRRISVPSYSHDESHLVCQLAA